MIFFAKRQHCFASPNKSPMLTVMSFIAWTTVALLFIPLLTQCSSYYAPTTQAVTGPFDSRGNYIEEWVDTPGKWYRPTAPTNLPKPTTAPRYPSPPQIAALEPRPSPSISMPKPVVVKPKPRVLKYSVKKGDSLSRIASRHGIGLSALRRANGIYGDLIRPGQVLTIPK